METKTSRSLINWKRKFNARTNHRPNTDIDNVQHSICANIKSAGWPYNGWMERSKWCKIMWFNQIYIKGVSIWKLNALQYKRKKWSVCARERKNDSENLITSSLIHFCPYCLVAAAPFTAFSFIIALNWILMRKCSSGVQLLICCW